MKLKEQLSSSLLIPFAHETLHSLQLYPNRLDPVILQRLRLSFLTSQTIMEFGGTEKLKKEVDFLSDFDSFNESCSTQFLIDSLEKDLKHHLKPREVYEQQLNEL